MTGRVDVWTCDWCGRGAPPGSLGNLPSWRVSSRTGEGWPGDWRVVEVMDAAVPSAIVRLCARVEGLTEGWGGCVEAHNVEAALVDGGEAPPF